MDENRLIEQAQKGNVGAFNALVLRYQDAVYNVAYRIMSEPDAAADVAQDTFITAYHSLRTFRGGHFKAWLLRIATNACYDELRRRKRRPQSSLDEMTEESDSSFLLNDHAAGPEEIQQQAELTQAIERCLGQLPDDQRIAAVLCDVEGYDYEEIARITLVSMGTVKSRLSRARARLRDCLQKLGELLPAAYRLTTQEIR